MAYRLIKDIKGYHIHICSSSNSSIEKSYDAYIVPLVIVAGDALTRAQRTRVHFCSQIWLMCHLDLY